MIDEEITEEVKTEFLAETRLHVLRVRDNMAILMGELNDRSRKHDASKFSEKEAPIFAVTTRRLKGSTYGSPEYKRLLKDLGPALDHHYKNNSHHPEHYENGIRGMCLVDVMEMFCDWLAAIERHDNGDIYRSIEINQDRFDMPVELCDIFRNTLRYFYKWKRVG